MTIKTKITPDDLGPYSTLTVEHGRIARCTPILLRSAGLDERNGEIIAQGFMDIEAIRGLRVDDYQREVLSIGDFRGKRRQMRQAVANGVRFNSIVVGMRGSDYDPSANKHDMILKDRVYIVDGLQRVSAMLFHAEEHPEDAKNLRVGVEVRFGTTKESEKELFIDLNAKRLPVSPNVILRNLRDNHPAILTLYGLSNSDHNFALYQRVCWNQLMKRGEFITASNLGRCCMYLHGYTHSASGQLMATALDSLAKRFGLANFRRNTITFFEVVDQCFGIRNVQYSSAQPHLKSNFLQILARLFAEYSNFWDGDNQEILVVDSKFRKKLATFAISDPEISRLCGAGMTAKPIIHKYLIDHLNKGKRLHRLKEKKARLDAA